jgi:hypothetical protein
MYSTTAVELALIPWMYMLAQQLLSNVLVQQQLLCECWAGELTAVCMGVILAGLQAETHSCRYGAGLAKSSKNTGNATVGCWM